jgi:hypothetical protein
MRVWFAAFFLMLAPGLQALSHDPESTWQTLSSPHFDVQFHQGLESLAPQTAALCERRFDELTATFKFKPSDRIQVVLADETDEANGAATAYPYNTIYLIVAPPDAEDAVDDLDAWMDFVISHELTHIFHLDHARGFPGALRRIFGRVPWAMPNYFQPAWILEGLATWAETDVERAVGRAQSPYFRGLMRLEMEGGFKSLRTVNQPLRSWPAGTTRYLYGSYFMLFLQETYGQDAVRKWVENYSDNWIPFFINRNAKQTFKKKLPALWKEYRAWLDMKLGPDMLAIKIAGLRGAPAPVDDAGAYRWGPYKGGYAVRNDGWQRPRLQHLDAAGHWETVGEAYVSSFSPGAGRILYTEDEVIRQSRFTRDLWEMDLNGHRHRLTWGLRVMEAVDSPTGVVALLSDLGEKKLVRLDAKGQVTEVLWQGSNGENLASICLSPDGLRLAAGKWKQGQGWDIGEFDLAGKTWKSLASRPEPELQPSYSADGSRLYFSAAYGGTFNIQVLAGGKVSQLTNTLGGAFHPWRGPGDKVYFSLQTAKGRVLGEVTAATATEPAPVMAHAGPPRPKPEDPPLSIGAARPYSPGPTLWPTAWYPMYEYGYAGAYWGAMVDGNDVLDRHHFTAQVYAGNDLPDTMGGFSYAYTRFLPLVGIAASRDSIKFSGDSTFAYRLMDQASVFAALPLQGRWRHFQLTAAGGAARYWDQELVRTLTPTAGADLEHHLVTGVVGMTYDAAARPIKAIKPVDGIQASLYASHTAVEQQYANGWVDCMLARPTSLGHGFELELLGTGGVTTEGYAQYYLGGMLPFSGASDHRLAFQPVASLVGHSAEDWQLQYGPSYAAGHLGLRFPLANIEWGIMAPPLGWDRIHGRIWADTEQIFDGAGLGRTPLHTVGADITVEWTLFYTVIVPMQMGWALGLGNLGSDRVYVRIGGTNF